MKNIVLKWTQTIKIAIIQQTAYRLNFFLQVIGPSLVFFFVKYNLWTSLYESNQETIIQGYNLEEMISYHCWVLLVALIAKSHTSMNLSEDIRLGRISTYLIYPFSFHSFHMSSFIGFQIIQLFIFTFTACILVTSNLISFPLLSQSLITISFCLLVSLLWFLLQYLAGVLAFWLEETWIVRVMIDLLVVFLSGAIIPLEFFPSALQKILQWTPFPYMIYYPVKMFQGNLSEVSQGISILSIWIILIFLLVTAIWKKGLRLYSGAGM